MASFDTASKKQLETNPQDSYIFASDLQKWI